MDIEKEIAEIKEKLDAIVKEHAKQKEIIATHLYVPVCRGTFEDCLSKNSNGKRVTFFSTNNGVTYMQANRRAGELKARLITKREAALLIAMDYTLTSPLQSNFWLSDIESNVRAWALYGTAGQFFTDHVDNFYGLLCVTFPP